MKEIFLKVTALLPSAESDAVSMSDLACLMDISERDLRSLVERMRRDGIAVCSSDNGYWLPADDDKGQQDIERTARRLESRARSQLKTAQRMRESSGTGAADER